MSADYALGANYLSKNLYFDPKLAAVDYALVGDYSPENTVVIFHCKNST